MAVLGFGAAACAGPRDELAATSPVCRSALIVALERAPDAALLAELGRASGAELSLGAPIGLDLYQVTLVAAGGEAQCAAAVERLRRDARVRSVDVDERRRAQLQGGSVR